MTTLKPPGLFRFFHENQWFFELFEIPITGDSLDPIFFSYTQTPWFFDSKIFQLPRTRAGITKNQIPTPHWSRCKGTGHKE